MDGPRTPATSGSPFAPTPAEFGAAVWQSCVVHYLEGGKLVFYFPSEEVLRKAIEILTSNNLRR